MNELLDHLDALLRQHATPIFDLMRSPATWEKIEAVERELGFRLPADMRAAYRWHDGQEYHGAQPRPRLFGTFAWMSLDDLVRSWSGCTDMLNELRARGEIPEEREVIASDQKIRFAVWNPSWVPVGDCKGGPLLCVDLAPGPGGCEGQLIEWFPDFPDGHALVAVNLEAHFQDLVQRLQSGSIRFSAVENRWVDATTGAVIEEWGYW
jgi:cell wall assembly regulator SMI1